MAKKTIVQSRTNRTIALVVGVVLTKQLTKYMPADIAAQVSSVLTDEVVSAVAVVLGGAAVAFRQLANSTPEDKQDIVTPRP